MPSETTLRGLSAVFHRRALLGVVLAVSLLAPRAWAWGPTGHMVVAQIAYQELSPSARTEADRLIAVLGRSDPRLAHFVPASVWMDEVRYSGMRALDLWHYVNLPINAEGLSSVAPAVTPNVVWAIDQAAATLANPQATDFEKAFMLRVLLHTVGDVHQPLHTVGRFTAALPNSDRGGNDFLLEVEGAPNLHALWDGLVGLYPRVDPKGEWSADIARMAQEVSSAVPPPPPRRVEWHEGAAAAWAREGFELAQQVVYEGIEEGGRPSEEYRQRAQGVIAERLLLAGLRLAAILDSNLGAGPPAEPLPVEAPVPSAEPSVAGSTP